MGRNPLLRYEWRGGPFDGQRTRYLGVLVRVYRHGDAYAWSPHDKGDSVAEWRDVQSGVMTHPGVYRCDNRAARRYVWHPMRSRLAQFGTL